eukprot:g13656.t1
MGNAGSRSGSSSTPPTAEAYFSAADAKILRELFAWLDDGTTDLEATTAPSFMHACICTATSSSTTSSDALAEKLLLMREVNGGMFSPDAVAAKERTASAAVDRFGRLILNLSPEAAQTRFRLVPGRMRETDFWYLEISAVQLSTKRRERVSTQIKQQEQLGLSEKQLQGQHQHQQQEQLHHLEQREHQTNIFGYLFGGDTLNVNATANAKKKTATAASPSASADPEAVDDIDPLHDQEQHDHSQHDEPDETEAKELNSLKVSWRLASTSLHHLDARCICKIEELKHKKTELLLSAAAAEKRTGRGEEKSAGAEMKDAQAAEKDVLGEQELTLLEKCHVRYGRADQQARVEEKLSRQKAMKECRKHGGKVEQTDSTTRTGGGKSFACKDDKKGQVVDLYNRGTGRGTSATSSSRDASRNRWGERDSRGSTGQDGREEDDEAEDDHDSDEDDLLDSDEDNGKEWSESAEEAVGLALCGGGFAGETWQDGAQLVREDEGDVAQLAQQRDKFEKVAQLTEQQEKTSPQQKVASLLFKQGRKKSPSRAFACAGAFK